MPYDEYQYDLSPVALRDPVGEAWSTAFGIMKDALVEGAIQAVKARYARTAPEDAVPYIAGERSLEQVPGETLYTFRPRIEAAWDAWRPYGGTKTGLVNAIGLFGLADFEVVESADWDATPGEWWNFWIYVNQPHPFTYGWHVGDGTIIGDLTARLGLKPYDLFSALMRAIKTWRPSHALMQACTFIFSGRIVGFDNWVVGDGSIIGADHYVAHF